MGDSADCAQNINAIVVGPGRKTVITLDMQLYEKAKQLEMAKPECKNQWVLHIGEMHTVMAALRAVGSSIEDRGINEAWTAADLYGPVTTRQILEARHIKRALDAHMTTIRALHELYIEEFYIEEFFVQYPEVKDTCMRAAKHLNEECAGLPEKEIQNAHLVMV